MKYISKQPGHRLLELKNANPPTCAQTATKAWKNFKGKSETALYCFREQKGLCGYSEVQLVYDTPIIDDITFDELGIDLGYHIEHIVPKSTLPDKTFDHLNLILSSICSESLKSLDRRDVFGGHAKQSWYCPNGFIHPLLEDCIKYFHHEMSGRVIPKANLERREKAKARLTIYRLNLNASILVNWRRNWLEQLTKIIDSLLDNPDALKVFAELELTPVNDVLRPFYSAQKQVFGRLNF